jgi:hypothetical protein
VHIVLQVINHSSDNLDPVAIIGKHFTLYLFKPWNGASNNLIIEKEWSSRSIILQVKLPLFILKTQVLFNILGFFLKKVFVSTTI